MSANDRLTKLKEKREQINTRIQLMENREKHKERKNETRRKILLGSYYLDNAEKNGTFEEIKKIMDKYLTRDSDRLLFDLTIKDVK
jgi:hypothetical protein